MKVDLRQLDYFLEIVERRSLTAAAAELRVTQPTLTKSIRQLEESLGVRLLERLPRGVVPTEFGAVLARHAGLVGVQLKDAVAEIEALRSGRVGHVAIGAGPAWLRRLLPLAVTRAQAASPGLAVYLTGGFDDGLLRLLRQGELDLVVAELPEPDTAPDLALLELASDDLGIVCRSGHPLAGCPGLVPTDLVGCPWILPAGNSRARRRLDALFIGRGLEAPAASIETDSMAFMLAAIRLSDGIGYATSRLLTLEEGSGLVMLDVEGLSGRRTAGVISRRQARLSPAAQAIVDELAAICRLDDHN
ncbi:MAG TPA: LysR family transcriptional regulator [Geminicoccaceae bacterium]|nr:LysR family transcriptional regulator [Geminicoccus sp.]HMU49800.1 LysR family transcriptional regulator [Geminicoccaceae bacterium]